MKLTKLVKALITFTMASVCALGVFAISGCSSSSSGELTADTGLTGGIAGSVNGEDIKEDKVTRAVNNLRISYGYTDQDEWKDFLKEANQTPEALRYSLLSAYVDELLVKQCADQLGVSVSDEDIDAEIEEMASKYSSQEAWENAVKDAGYEDGIEGYKETLKYSMLQKEINQIFSEEVQEDMKDNKKVLTAVNESISEYDGAKRTSMVLFSTDEENLAKVTRKKIADGEMTIEDAAAKYSLSSSAKEDGGDMGWDVLKQYSEDYASIVESLEKEGDVSKATQTDSGWVIVQLKSVYNAPKKITKLGSVPEDFVTDIKTNSVSNQTSEKYSDWKESLKDQQDVVVNPMPENVPYNVDMSDVYSEDEMKKINDEAYEKLVGNVETEEAEDTAVENGVQQGEGSSSDTGSATEGSDGEAASDSSSEQAGDQASEAESVENDEADSGE